MLRLLRQFFGQDPYFKVIIEQDTTIAKQRAHIRNLDARIAKLEHEADGLRQLL